MSTVPEGLRRAAPNDLRVVRALIMQAYGGYLRQLGVRPGPMDDDYASLIAQHRVQVVERGGALLALLVLIPQPDAMLLDNIAVAPQVQGTGLGKALIRYAEQRAMEAGFQTIRLYTHARMTRNQAIYAAAGYQQTRRIFERGLDRVYMEKRLD